MIPYLVIPEFIHDTFSRVELRLSDAFNKCLINTIIILIRDVSFL